jgi:hypothetical protein
MGKRSSSRYALVILEVMFKLTDINLLKSGPAQHLKRKFFALHRTQTHVTVDQ